MSGYVPTRYVIRGDQVIGTRQIVVTFTPWRGGSTHAHVVVETHSGARRFVHRVGVIELGVGRSDLVGLTPSEVTVLLVANLHQWLCQERSTLPQAVRPPAPPSGVTGAAVQAPGQLSLDLDLRE